MRLPLTFSLNSTKCNVASWNYCFPSTCHLTSRQNIRNRDSFIISDIHRPKLHNASYVVKEYIFRTPLHVPMPSHFRNDYHDENKIAASAHLATAPLPLFRLSPLSFPTFLLPLLPGSLQFLSYLICQRAVFLHIASFNAFPSWSGSKHVVRTPLCVSPLTSPLPLEYRSNTQWHWKAAQLYFPLLDFLKPRASAPFNGLIRSGIGPCRNLIYNYLRVLCPYGISLSSSSTFSIPVNQ